MTEEETLCSNYHTSTISRNLPLLRVPSMIFESSSLSLIYPSSCLPILPPLPYLLQRILLEKQQRCRKRSTNVNIVIEHSVGVNIEADMRGRVSLLVSNLQWGDSMFIVGSSPCYDTSHLNFSSPSFLLSFTLSPTSVCTLLKNNNILPFHPTPHSKLILLPRSHRHERATLQMSKVQEYLCPTRPLTATRSDCACERWRYSSSQRSQASDSRAENVAQGWSCKAID